MIDDYKDEKYYQQLEDNEWQEYIDVCLEHGCLECGHEITTGSELNNYHSCIYCEGGL